MPTRTVPRVVPSVVSNPEDVIAGLIEEALPLVFASLRPFQPRMDANPKGMEAIVMSATLRAAADLIELRFQEGDEVGPLKTSVDELRARMFQMFQQMAK